MNIEKTEDGYTLRDDRGGMCAIDRNYNGTEAWACSAIDQLIDQLIETAECLRRIVSYYDDPGTGHWLPSMRDQAESQHENTMFGAARAALHKLPPNARDNPPKE